MTHAWLFTGPPGSGRSVAARAFASALLCPDGGCGGCDSCRQARARTHPNLVVVEPAGLSISVDEARRVVRAASLSAAGGRTHVVVVEDADRLTEAAANAWLKAIEEPEPGTVFLLCAPSPEDLPPTIRSRCRLVTLRLPNADDVAAVLVRDGVDEATALWAAAAAQGHVGRARALATNEHVRAQRDEALRLPARLATVGECLAAAADLVAAADAEADRQTKDVAAAEKEQYAETIGTGRGTAGIYSDLAKKQKSRETRARRDSLDRALVDLAAWYRDVLAVQMGARTPLVHADQADAIARAAAMAASTSSVDALAARATTRPSTGDRSSNTSPPAAGCQRPPTRICRSRTPSRGSAAGAKKSETSMRASPRSCTFMRSPRRPSSRLPGRPTVTLPGQGARSDRPTSTKATILPAVRSRRCRVASGSMRSSSDAAASTVGQTATMPSCRNRPRVSGPMAATTAPTATTGTPWRRARRATPTGSFPASVWESTMPSAVMASAAPSRAWSAPTASRASSMPGRSSAPQKAVSPNPRPPAAPEPGRSRSLCPTAASTTSAKWARAASSSRTVSGDAPFCGP
jgi:DNA polymerase-3 subunit delta'